MLRQLTVRALQNCYYLLTILFLTFLVFKCVSGVYLLADDCLEIFDN